MSGLPKRDITGNCRGECRDRVRELEERQQEEIEASGLETSGEVRNVPWASSRNAPPGFLGGHV